jgi:hypothetical protein
MKRPDETRGRAPWIAILATAALAVGLSAAWWYSRPPGPPSPPTASSLPDSGPAMPDDTIHRGLRRAVDDSTAIKTRWVDEVPGFDVSTLDPARREIFVRFANAERCTCGCGYTLAACRVYDSTCEVSGPRVQSLLDSVRAGRIKSASGLRQRPDGSRRSGAPGAAETRSGGR